MNGTVGDCLGCTDFGNNVNFVSKQTIMTDDQCGIRLILISICEQIN